MYVLCLYEGSLSASLNVVARRKLGSFNPASSLQARELRLTRTHVHSPLSSRAASGIMALSHDLLLQLLALSWPKSLALNALLCQPNRYNISCSYLQIPYL